MDIYTSLIKLAKNIKYQNLFSASKEIRGIRLFKNTYNFSKVQEIFLSYLYIFDSIHKDIVNDSISEKVLDNDTNIYWESYLIWKRKHNKNTTQSKKKEVELVSGNKIKFNKRIKK